MRTTLIALFLLLLATTLQAQQTSPATQRRPNMDSIVSQMQNYYLVILTRGPNLQQDSVTLERLMDGHMNNIQRLAKAGKLILAGPFLDNGKMRGIFVFDAANEAEARALVDSDPAVKAGRFSYELHPWMGPKALKTILKPTTQPDK